MHEYARHFIASTAAQVLPCKGSSLKAAMVRQFLPYCLSPVSGGVILLNREYKPLGWPPRRKGRVDYSDPMFTSLVVDVDGFSLSLLPRVISDSGDFFYFYGGPSGDSPWTTSKAALDYIAKLGSVLDIREFSREGAGA